MPFGLAAAAAALPLIATRQRAARETVAAANAKANKQEATTAATTTTTKETCSINDTQSRLSRGAADDAHVLCPHLAATSAAATPRATHRCLWPHVSLL